MLDKNGIIKRLLLADSAAKKEAAYLKGLDAPTLSDYEKSLHQYILYKFLLDDEPDVTTDYLNILADLSVSKAGKLNPKEGILLDVSRHCGSTSSSMTKKVLLFMSIQEDFEVNLHTANTADIETVGQLAYIIWQMKQAK